MKIILNIINKEDKELFEVCIDTLRCLIKEDTKDIILERPELLEKVRSLALTDHGIIQIIYKEFLNKMEN